MKRLLVFLKDYKKETVLAPLFKLLEASFELLIPLVVAAIVDQGIGQGDLFSVYKLGGIMVLLGVAFSLVPSAMWPSVPKIIPLRLLGSAYALIFWVQNIGLGSVPLLIGNVLSDYCIVGTVVRDGNEVPLYDYTIPMLIFACFGVIALGLALWLKSEDRKKNYGLEKPNIVA